MWKKKWDDENAEVTIINALREGLGFDYSIDFIIGIPISEVHGSTITNQYPRKLLIY